MKERPGSSAAVPEALVTHAAERPVTAACIIVAAEGPLVAAEAAATRGSAGIAWAIVATEVPSSSAAADRVDPKVCTAEEPEDSKPAKRSARASDITNQASFEFAGVADTNTVWTISCQPHRDYSWLHRQFASTVAAVVEVVADT
jgi:hypothetical protein